MMASCKEASRLASDSLNRRLTLRENLALRTHLFMCAACRRFEKQIAFLHRATARIGATDAGAPLSLPSTARERIAQRIQQTDQPPAGTPRQK
jgi:predicted anti-sigma-YlaC factor YlaD